MEFICNFLCYLFLLLCYSPFGFADQVTGPMIIDLDESTTLLPGKTFTIVCKGNVALKWTRTEIPSIQDIIDRARFSTNESHANSEFINQLYFRNVSYEHTGEYKCHGISNNSYTKSIYIYVKDLDKLSLLPTNRNIYTSIEQKQITLPCIPTFPEVEFNMTTKIEEHQNIEKNIQRGFTVSNISWNVDSADYNCNFSYDVGDGNKKLLSVDIHVYVEETVNFLPKPEIEILGGDHTVNGGQLELRCWIRDFRNVIDSSWITPSDPIDPKRIQVKNGELIIKKTSSKLDKGLYKCIVKDNQNHFNSTSIIVTIFDKDELVKPHFEQLNTTTFNIKIGESVSWNIRVFSHPIANVSWYNLKDEKIENDKNDYKVTFRNEEAHLKIMKTSYVHHGKYTLVASNSLNGKQKSQNSQEILLNVHSSPIIEIEEQKLHLINKYANVECSVTAFPFIKNVSIGFQSQTSTEIENLMYEERKANGEIKNTFKASFLAVKNGKIICEATNLYNITKMEVSFLVSDIENELEILHNFPTGIHFDQNEKTYIVAKNSPLEMTCAASRYTVTDTFFWYCNDTLLTSDSDNIQINNNSTDYSFRSNLVIKSAENSGEYKCQALRTDSTMHNGITISISVKEAKKPAFTSKSLDIVEINISHRFKFDCSVSGVPFPQIKWYKDGKLLENKTNVLYDYDQILILHKTELNDDGIYKCVAENLKGSIEKSSTLKFKDKPKDEISKISIVAISVLLLLVIIVVVFLFIKIRKEKKLQRELQNAGLANFEKGSPECVNPDLGLEDQAELLPYDKKWEFPIEKLKLGRQLGSGAFGVVLRGEAKGISLDEESTTVAVKMVKRNADNTYIKALASELKIMVHLGQHLNVVNLLGAITKHVGKRELMVIVEYCRYGNIQNYLLRHRETFVDQVDPSTGNIDYNIGLEEFERTRSVSSTPSSPPYLKYADLLLKQRSRLNSSTVSTNGEDIVMSSGSVQPDWRSNYHGDYKDGTIQPICTKDLLSWTFQVARGMEYLASRKVLHGDLAARNILLADNNIVKICDFGLAKTMYKDDNYKKKSDGPLPVKWMAIESIRDRVFSTQSDVWAFGVVLWEFFSLGKTPYPGMEADEKFYNKVLDGYRMLPPEYAPQNIAKMMSDCWLVPPNSRPSFSQLSERIGSMLEDSVRQHYIDLNDPYLMINTQRIENGYNDYLAMFAPPNFDQLASPRDYEVSSPIPSYLDMTPAKIFSPRAETGQVFDFDVANKKRGCATEMVDLNAIKQPDTSVECNSVANLSYQLAPIIDKMCKDMKSNSDYVNIPINIINYRKVKKDNVERPYVNGFVTEC